MSNERFILPASDVMFKVPQTIDFPVLETGLLF